MKAPTFNPWPLTIIGIGFFFLALTAWSVYQARSGVSEVIDPAYYSHGLKFQQTAVELRAAESLGWRLRTNLVGHVLDMHLIDGAQKPIGGAEAELNLFAATAQDLSLELHETAPGRYQVRLPNDLHGAVPATIRFLRDGALLAQHLQLNLAAAE